MGFVRALAVLILAALAITIFMLLYEIILCPVKPGKGERLEAVLRVSGSAPGLENTLRGLLWLKSSGRVRMSITIVDEGMDSDTRQTAELICREKNDVRLMSAGEAAREESGTVQES